MQHINHNFLIENKQSYYDQFLNTAKKIEEKRMGYPLTGSISGFFSSQGWVKDKSADQLFDKRQLGILPNSLSDILMLNIGDPESYRETELIRNERGEHYPEDIENEIIYLLTKYFGTNINFVKGYVTSGGTEANLASIWWLRNYLQNLNMVSSHVVLYASRQSHYSCAKVCQILNIELKEIDCHDNGQINNEKLRFALEQHRLFTPHLSSIIWANAGTTINGAIDDLSVIHHLVKNIILEKGGKAAIHTDGAILGMMLPIFSPHYQLLFDYTDTLTISGHKLLATSLACGVVLAKKNIIEEAFKNKAIKIGYVHGIKDITISGGRSSLPIFQLHFALKQLNFDTDLYKFKQLITTSLNNANYLSIQLKNLIGDKCVFYNPNQFNVIFKLIIPEETAKFLFEKYTLMSVEENKACITVLAHVDRKLIDEFVADYKHLIESSKNLSCIKARL